MASKKSFDHSASSLPPEDIRMSYTRVRSSLQARETGFRVSFLDALSINRKECVWKE